ncbi:sigma-70 family RNA polymerase sigma factor [Galbibacter sp. EGI 63066]|uniref:sigma-70 family RNA polymerase sigma factor n=1 Tax=Galbibacter sp. EGI 63066 TaxID=2993559 RepID=UPI0022487E14|nr:sigma-70 family RNA polymerase sigma factor [Galbibacter sp. EGI 63066]MCX2682122.1 sigma-70 family RNA polymerase sigma factor [Galbibacter sp. EGI 63066]
MIEEFYIKKKQEMISYSYSICKDMEMSKDIVQNLFLDLLQKDLSEIENIDGYVYKAIKLNTYNLLYRHTKKKGIMKTIYKEKNNVGIINNEKHYDFIKESILKGYIESLPEKRQKAFIMKRLEGRSIREISKIMCISKKTVENHITNAIKDLKRKAQDLQ